MNYESSLNGSRSTKVIKNSHTLWSYTTLQCPIQVPFSITLPSTFQDGDDFRALPPSYDYVKREGPTSQKLFVKYQLRFVVSCVRHQKLQDIWQKKQQYVYRLQTSVSMPFINFLLSIVIPFNYVPRTCPVRPIVATPCFFSSVKTTPEEWHQAITCLEMRRSDVEMGPIFCHVCFPKTTVPSNCNVPFIDSSSFPLVEYMVLQTPSTFIYRLLVLHALYISSSPERIWMQIQIILPSRKSRKT